MILSGVTAALVVTAPASAQNYRESQLSQGVDMLPLPGVGVNGERFTVPKTSTPAGPDLFGGNTLFWSEVKPLDIVWDNGDPFNVAFQNLAFRSADSTVRKVFWAVYDFKGDGGFTTEYRPTLGIEHLSLENVDIDPGTAQLAFTGTSFSWTMSNARYATSTRTPTFKVTSPLEMSAVAGTSSLAFWNGEIGSPTKIVVDPGATLVFERVGDIGKPDEIDRQLFFSQSNVNTADVKGGTLRLEFSGVVFDAAPDAIVAGGEVTGGFVVRDGGTLDLRGTDGDDASSRLELRGGMLVDDGTVSLRRRTSLELGAVGEADTLVLNNATVDLEANARLKASFTTFGGTSTVTTAASETESFRSPLQFQDASTILNIRGTGDFFAEGLIRLNDGTLNLDMAPSTGTLISTGAIFGPGTINVERENLFVIRDQFDQRTYGTNLVNKGIIRVENSGLFSAAGTIAETDGVVFVALGGELDGNTLSTGDPNLAVDKLNLEFGSNLVLAIDPTAGQASLVRVEELILDRPASSLSPNLTIKPLNDTALPAGQKLVLVDYSSLSSGSNFPPQFSGLPDGHVFQLGLNTYQIRYSDSEYDADNNSVVTLTVIDTDVLDDYYTVIESGTLSVPSSGVLENDPFFVLLGGSAQLVSGPANGDLVLNSNGSFDYVPASGFSGSDSFTYEVVSDGVVSGTAVVRIDVNSVESFLTALDHLAAEVDLLCVNGTLNRGQCRSLQVKLINARRDFIAGNDRAAGNLLRAFEHEVSAMERSGRISPSQAGMLLRLANVCISLL